MKTRVLTAGALLALVAAGCQTGQPAGEQDAHVHDDSGEHGHAHGEGESWSVTAWGEHFEIFAEADPLAAWGVVNAHTHVTLLDGFSPLLEGTVSVVLRSSTGEEFVFDQPFVLRDGIFDVEVVPTEEGEFELLFRIEGAGMTEEIPAGRVRVGDEDHPGGLVEGEDRDPQGEDVAFLKEQQWRTRFATEWVKAGTVRDGARGTGRVLPAAGGELTLSAPVDGVVAWEPWPYVGLASSVGDAVLGLSSRVSQGRTLAELEAVDTEKSAELELARERLNRLEGLLEVGAVSHAEVDAARARVQTLEAQAESARRQMAAVRGAGGGNQQAPVLEVTAPFAGEVAEILVRPGQAVTAGDPLVRMVRVEPVWLEVHLSPREAQRLQEGVAGLWTRATGDGSRALFEGEQVELLSIAPEVSSRTGRVAALLRVDTAGSRLRLGSAVEVEVLLAAGDEGVVIPASAVIDDAGVPVAYVQLDGENFERRVLAILAREGDRYLVDGVGVNERLVTDGGAAIRRATLMGSGGAGHGHVH